MSETRRKRKPRKNGRKPEEENTSESEATVPKGIIEKQYNQEDPKQRLREKIKQMQKDRAKGSYVCEENANHEY
jgi:hypothetical protein|tara:strand:+ start:642 stop:863 length:222 start_codon:yes stop_codon:yes gene_type:complete